MLTFDMEKRNGVLQPEKGLLVRQSWTYDITCCPSPFCGCKTLHVYASRADAKEKANHPVHFILNVESKKFSYATEKHSARERDLAKAFVAEMNSNLWQQFSDVMVTLKREQIETLDAETIPLDNPTDFILEDQSLLVPYGKVLPAGLITEFDYRGENWFFVDRYCTAHKCQCTDVFLGFFGTTSARKDLPEEEYSEICSFFYDYASGNVSKVETTTTTSERFPSPTELLTAAKIFNPQFDQTLKTRHHQLRTIFKRARKEAADAVPVSTKPSVGRNDPCPCGSGKKYKKCCLMK